MAPSRVEHERNAEPVKSYVEPAEGCTVDEYIHWRLAEAWGLIYEHESHMLLWGAYCGPTVSMAHPPILRGITSL